MKIAFDYPFFLLMLFLGICFFKCKRENLKIFFSKIDFLPKFSLKKASFMEFFIFSLLVLSLSSPFTYESFQIDKRKGRDLVLAIDASGSMDESLKGSNKSKFQIVLEDAREFIKNRFDDNIGVVIFGSFSYIASPITYDMKALEFILKYLETQIAGNNTAIGEAIFRSVEALKKGDAKEKVIILLTDGHHNSGSISPKKAVEEAKKIGARIYTLAIADADASLLKKIAKESGGEFFHIKDKSDLKEVFKRIDSLEPSLIRSGIYKGKKYLFPYFLSFAFFLLLYLFIKRMV